MKTISEYDIQTFIILYQNIVSGKILYIWTPSQNDTQTFIILYPNMLTGKILYIWTPYTWYIEMLVLIDRN